MFYKITAVGKGHNVTLECGHTIETWYSDQCKGHRIYCTECGPSGECVGWIGLGWICMGFFFGLIFTAALTDRFTFFRLWMVLGSFFTLVFGGVLVLSSASIPCRGQFDPGNHDR